MTATVNYSTEKARVDFPPAVAPEELAAAVAKIGYTATLPPPPPEPLALTGETDEADGLSPNPTQALRQRLIVSTVLTVPVVVLAMVPALLFPNWQWLSLTLAAPVVVWGA